MQFCDILLQAAIIDACKLLKSFLHVVAKIFVVKSKNIPYAVKSIAGRLRFIDDGQIRVKKKAAAKVKLIFIVPSPFK